MRYQHYKSNFIIHNCFFIQLHIGCRCDEKLTSFNVESISVRADNATASCDMSFCKQESPMTLSFTDLTSQAIRNIRTISSFCAISLGLDKERNQREENILISKIQVFILNFIMVGRKSKNLQTLPELYHILR